MRFIAIAGLAGLSIAIASGVNPVTLWQTFQQLYPSDPAERQALDECFTQDPQLNRFDAASRDACLRRMLPAMAANDAAEHQSQQAGNFVDLWRASGQGTMQQNDIRNEEQNDRYTHAASTLQLH